MKTEEAITELRTIAARVETIAREVVTDAPAPSGALAATRSRHDRRVAEVDEAARSCVFVLKALAVRIERLCVVAVEDRRCV